MSAVSVRAPTGSAARLRAILADDPELGSRFEAVRSFSRGIRASEYHLTNSCNIRCEGCWFFTFEFDSSNTEQHDPVSLETFIDAEVKRGVNAALLIGGEPTLFPNRIRAYRDRMPYVTISTNGLRPLTAPGLDDITIAISLFGGGELDDELRAIRPGGKRFTGLFDTALDNYRGDPRAGFVFALSERGIDYIEETVARIGANGNRVHFNYYSAYHLEDPLRQLEADRLLAEALRVRAAYPEVVASHPYYIEAMITGSTEWGSFSYDVCPSISIDNPSHRDRLRNGAPSLPRFNVWGADLETLQFCCTSGHCADCRDSQAVMSWLMVSPLQMASSAAHVRTWIEMAEAYWSQFFWSPFHPLAGSPVPARPAAVDRTRGHRADLLAPSRK